MKRRELQPYPGLRPFERSESKIFFGRQKQVDDLLQRLKDGKFLAVLGASGSGKSSLVKAGLLPGLEKGYMGELGANWRIVELRPGDQPFERLAEGLQKQIPSVSPFAKGSTLQTETEVIEGSPPLKKGEQGGFSSQQTTFLAAQLRRGARSLHTLLEQSPPENGEKLLILVDQFEEIFRYHQQAGNQAAAFVALLLEACTHPDVFVVITMRSDFLGDAAAFHGLPEAINDGLYLTPRLSREQLREAIALPAKLFGGEVEDALVNRFLNEAGNDPDQLPLLQHALMRLWGMAEDQQLTFQDLDGLRGALDGHLERVFTALNPAQQAIAEVMFRLLTDQGEDGQAIRRPAKVREVLAAAHCELDELVPVVDAFRGVGRHFLMTSTPELNEATVLDISHESLIRQWWRLHGWVEDEAAKVKVYHRLMDAAQRHSGGQGELWHGTDLALGLDWRCDTQPDAVWAQRYHSESAGEFDLAAGFLAESEEAERQQQREEKAQRQRELEKQREEVKRSRRQLAFAVVGLLIAAGLAVWGAVERTRAEQQTEIANQAAERAEKQKNFAELETKRAEKQKKLAQQEAERADTESERAKAAEEIRTRQLFDSDTTHASLLAQMEDYAGARKKLAKTRYLDDKVPVERRHARDLLAGFVGIMGGEAERTFTDLEGKPLPQLSGNVAVSQDGQWLAASGERGAIALFERASGRLVQKLVGHDPDVGSQGSVFDIVFHPEQPWLFSAGADGQIIWWQLPQDGEDAEVLEQWSVDAGEASALALTPDGEVLASGHDDGGIRLWGLKMESTAELPSPSGRGAGGEGEGRQPLKTLTGHQSIIANGWGLTFDPQGRWLASASYDDTVRLWDWQNGEAKHVLRGHNGYAQGVAFSPNGQWLASSSVDQSIILWDVESGRGIRRFKGHQNMVFDLQFINDQLLASASSDNTVRLWDVETGVTRRVLQGHTAAVAGLALYEHDKQSWLYSNSNDGTVKQWRADLPGQWLVDLPSEPASTAISPTGELLALGYANGNLELYDLATLKLLDQIEDAHSGDVNRLDFTSRGDLLASAGGNNARIWQIDKLKLISKNDFDEHSNMVHAVTFSPDNIQLATASYDGTFGLFDLESGKGELFDAHEGGDVNAISFSADGKYLSSNGDREIKLWDISTQLPTSATIATANDALLWATLSPNGSHLASVGREHIVTIHPTQGQQPPLRLHGHEQTVYKAIFSPDSRQLATMGADSTVRLWDLDTESELFRLHFPTHGPKPNPAWDFDFRCTPTGCWIAVPLTSGKLALYNLGKIDY